MVRFTVLASSLAILPAVLGQDTTSTSVSCQTIMGSVSIPAAEVVTVTNQGATQTIINNSTTTTGTTVTITPDATTFSGVFTTTETLSTLITITPSVSTVAVPTSFLPFQRVAATPAPAPTAAKRLVDRQAPGQTCAVDNGVQQGFDAIGTALVPKCPTFPNAVVCTASTTVTRVVVFTITADPTTVTASAHFVTLASSTATVTETSASTSILPQSTLYAACAADNVVNNVNGSFFAEIQYIPAIEVARQRVTNTTDAYSCCVACQTTANCAGSFYHPPSSTCHISLSHVDVTNTTANGTTFIEPFCAQGSGTDYLGEVRPRNVTAADAVVVSNGQCGRWSFNPSPASVGGVSFTLGSTLSTVSSAATVGGTTVTDAVVSGTTVTDGVVSGTPLPLMGYKRRWYI